MKRIRPEYTEWVTVKAKVEKTHEPVNEDQRGSFPLKTVWARTEFEQPVQAAYLGYSLRQEGMTRIETEYGEYGSILSSWKEFTRSRTFEVWEFGVAENRVGFFALPEDVIFEPTYQERNGFKVGDLVLHRNAGGGHSQQGFHIEKIKGDNAILKSGSGIYPPCPLENLIRWDEIKEKQDRETFWRTLIRVERVYDLMGVAHICIPAWNPHRDDLLLHRSSVPEHVWNHILKANMLKVMPYRLYAKVNTGVEQPEHLEYQYWEYELDFIQQREWNALSSEEKMERVANPFKYRGAVMFGGDHKDVPRERV